MSAPPLCPVDDEPLAPHAHGALAFHGCARCHGLWFTEGAIEGTRHGAVPADPFANHSDRAPTPHVAWRVRLCPGCRGTLRTKQVDGVEVDTCPACRSVWLDAGELDTVVAWQRLRDRSLTGPAVGAAAALVAPTTRDASSRITPAGETGGAADVVEAVAEVALGEPWLALELVGDLAGFLGDVVVGGAEVALEAAGAVLSLVAGALDGL